MNERRYRKIFNEFLHSKFDKNELMKRIAQAEKENLDYFAVFDEINMIDLESKKFKGVRHCFVD